MILKYFLTLLSFFVVSVFQTSFLAFFKISGGAANLIFLLFIALVYFLGTKDYNYGLFLSIIAGFFSDVFSNLFFGFSVIVFIALFLSVKYIFYIIKESDQTNSIVYFLAVFSGCFLTYGIILRVALGDIAINKIFLAGFLYNLFLAYCIFYLFNFLKVSLTKNRQLNVFRQ